MLKFIIQLILGIILAAVIAIGLLLWIGLPQSHPAINWLGLLALGVIICTFIDIYKKLKKDGN